jgi:hypothetical protein
VWHRQACPYLELKTWSRFCPVCLSLSMAVVNLNGEFDMTGASIYSLAPYLSMA